MPLLGIQMDIKLFAGAQYLHQECATETLTELLKTLSATFYLLVF